MHIKLRRERTADGSTRTFLEVVHSLNDGGIVTTTFMTNNVVFLDIDGEARREIDFTREEPKVLPQHEHIVNEGTYAGFIQDEEDGALFAHQFGIVRGTTAKDMIRTSTDPHRLEFYLLED